MSSAGQAIGGIVGGAIGFFTGGPVGLKYGAQLGIMAGGLLDPPKVTGPRLSDLSVQINTYGAFIPRVYGTVALTGNIFWLLNDKLTERKKTSGGKGGPKTTTYQYYATFAVGLCEGPIDGIRRLWVGSDLLYDAGSDDLGTIISSNENASLFDLYTGTETQEPDPLIQADKGIANVSAYRGLAYIVIKDLPLEKYGNNLLGAQVKVEVVKSAGFTNHLVEAYSIDGQTDWYSSFKANGNPHDQSGFSNFIAHSTSNYPAWVRYLNGSVLTSLLSDATDPILPGGATMYPHASPGEGFQTSLDTQHYAFSRTGGVANKYFVWGAGGHLEAFDTGTNTNALVAFAERSGVIYAMWTVSTTQTWLAKIFGESGAGRLKAASARIDIHPDTPALAVWGEHAVTAQGSSSAVVGSLTIKVYGESGGALSQIDTYTLALPLSVSGDAYSIDYLAASGYVEDDKLFIVSRASASLANAVVVVVDLLAKTLLGAYNVPQSFPLITVHSRPAVKVEGNLVYYSQRNSSVTDGFVGNTWQLNRVGANTVQLGDVVEAECLTSNIIQAADINVSSLIDPVRGYRISSLGPIRGGIDPLRKVWPFDVRQHGYEIEFVRRGGASVASIPAADLDAREVGQAPGVQIVNDREMDLQLPNKVLLNYIDLTREYDTNSAEESRASTDTVNVAQIEVSAVMTAEESKRATAALLYLAWLERYDIQFRLPPTYLNLEPADVVTVTTDDATYSLRLTSVAYLPDGRLECRAKYNEPAIYQQVSVADEGASTGATIGLAGPTALALLDIPLMRDDADTPGFPAALSGYTAAWPGGLLYRSEDGGQTWQDLSMAESPGAVIGYATGTLAGHGGTMLDKASTLTVRLYSGTLASVTEAQMFAGQNWFAYGAHGRWEIIAAQNCILQGDGSYVLSDFMRSQNGTGWASELHQVNDAIVLLDVNDLDFVSVNSSAINSPHLYRGVTVGKALDSATDQAFTYTGVNLECLAPVHLTGNRHPTTNDWTLTWVRQSRFAGWRDYIDAPLGEASEAYEVEIYTSAAYTTLKRTITGLSSATASYTSAQQVTDFGSNQATLYLKIYQLSATVGRGYPLTATITR